jgi:hypothetical protein
VIFSWHGSVAADSMVKADAVLDANATIAAATICHAAQHWRVRRAGEAWTKRFEASQIGAVERM